MEDCSCSRLIFSSGIWFRPRRAFSKKKRYGRSDAQEFIYFALRRCGHALAVKHRDAREEPLGTGSLALIVVDEIETTFAQFQYGKIGRPAYFERAAVAEHRKCARGIYGCASHHLVH